MNDHDEIDNVNVVKIIKDAAKAIEEDMAKIDDLQSQLDHWKTQAMKYREALEYYSSNVYCKNGVNSWRECGDKAREALKDGGVE